MVSSHTLVNNEKDDIIYVTSMNDLAQKMSQLTSRMNTLRTLMIIIVISVIVVLCAQLGFVIYQLVTKKAHPEPAKIVVHKNRKSSKSKKSKRSRKSKRSSRKSSRSKRIKKVVDKSEPSRSIGVNLNFDKVSDEKERNEKQQLILATTQNTTSSKENPQQLTKLPTGSEVSLKSEIKTKLAAPVWTTSTTEPLTAKTPLTVITPPLIQQQAPPIVDAPMNPPTVPATISSPGVTTAKEATIVSSPGVATAKEVTVIPSPGTGTAKETTANKGSTTTVMSQTPEKEVKSVSLALFQSGPPNPNQKSTFLGVNAATTSAYFQPK